MTFNRRLTNSDRAVIRHTLGELLDGLEATSDTDVCGVLVGMFCYAVLHAGGTQDNALQIVRQTWTSVVPDATARKTPRGQA